MPSARPRLAVDRRPAVLYAIGDVHGCLDQLLALEAQIVADAAAIDGEKWIVNLGDYVDRGPAVRGVIDHLLAEPPAGFRRFCLVGNHEQLLLDFLANPAATLDWLEWGGEQTAAAYGLVDAAAGWRRQPGRFAEKLRPLLPAAHLEFFAGLPTCLSIPGFFFVHAGIRPGVALEAQLDNDLIWIRAPFLRGNLPADLTIVHGHTPVDAVEFAPGRVDVDTGCFFSGVLSALRVTADGDMRVLQARGAPSDYIPVSQR